MGRKFLTIGRMALLAGILVAVGLVSGIIGMQLAIRGDDVATPDLVGQPLDEAESSLQDSHLQMAVISRHYDDSAEEGSIISQTPSPGTRVKPGQKVRVIVSRGVRKEPVPNLLGETLRSAGAKLVETDYRLGAVSEILMQNVEDGQVVKQYPEPGSEKSGGTQIDLLVARRTPPSFVMPDILGERLSNVLLVFERRGMSVGEIRYRPQRGARRGTILRQYPEPGGRLKATDRINVEVASRWR
ncbi:MAG TPA: PASTA domain-containing protein [Acidobacteriota bacterium]|nr:PASTA domain-containing protein [Acidobacteriota bacterium]